MRKFLALFLLVLVAALMAVPPIDGFAQSAKSDDAAPKQKQKSPTKKSKADIATASKPTAKAAAKSAPKPERKLTERERALLALNRLTFGPRPGDVDRVLAIGVDAWVAEQLAPAATPDDALDAKLAPFRTLKMQPLEVLTDFPNGNFIRQVMDRKKQPPADPVLAGLYEILVARQREQDATNRANALATNTAPTPGIVVVPDRSANKVLAGADKNQIDKPTVITDANDMAGNSAPNRNTMAETNPMAGNMAGTTPNSTAATSANGNTVAKPNTPPANGNMLSGVLVMPTANTMSEEEVKKAADAKKKFEDDTLTREVAEKLFAVPREQRMSALMNMPLYDRQVFARNLNSNNQIRDRFNNEASFTDKEIIQAINNPSFVVVNELQQAKLLRAIYSQRQLEEVMTDFWYNHFNVFLYKDVDNYLVTSYERDAIRANALGKFRDLLFATARHPAMVYYLDNNQSVGPDSPNAEQQRKNRKDGSGPGLNENYAREVMELHTLGVDGGYTQEDVTELARILTGWGVASPEKGYAFEFHPRAHQPGTKHLLGKIFYENGEQEGVDALNMLAGNPATAHFICKKIATRFVSDDPPEELIEKMARTFLSTDGDIREVLRTLFTSEEFWKPSTVHAKTKTPLEFVVSAVRSTGTDVQNVQPLTQQLQRMGMPLYQMQPPTGYKMIASAWMNSDALIDRLNFSLGFVGNKIGGVRFDAGRTLAFGLLTRPDDPASLRVEPGMEGALDLLQNALLGDRASDTTLATIRNQLADPDVTGKVTDDPMKPLGVAIGLLLGSPEFQKR